MNHGSVFHKYQGCGNDFVIVDEMQGKRTSDTRRSQLARRLTDRHFGIGADGVIFIERSKGVDGSMRLFEPAGNEADMCGNGIRCVGAYLMDKLGKDSVNVLSRDGIKKITRSGKGYTVNMGVVRTAGRYLKAYYTGVKDDNQSLINLRLVAGGRPLIGSLVNSGEPHFVTRTRNLQSLPVKQIGDQVNSDRRLFPRGLNLNFVEVASAHSIRTRTYERGVYDETLACGTGATASAAASLMLGWVSDGPVKVMTRGGTLEIRIGKDGTALMKGPAVHVFDGEF